MNRGRSMTCKAVRARLALFVGDDLPPVEAEAVRVHLRACCSCRQQASGQLHALRVLRSLPAEAPERLPVAEEPFFAALQARVMQSIEPPAGAGGRLSAFARAHRHAGVAAAAALLFLLGIWFARPVGGLAHRAPIQPSSRTVVPPIATPGGVVLQPLGYRVEDGLAGEIDGSGATGLGLGGRRQLRTLAEGGGSWFDDGLSPPVATLRSVTREGDDGDEPGWGGLLPLRSGRRGR